ncbi:MAG: hypothetical protein A3G52_01445 [Candidatus Taylorbacteria bacterium RIFCSPLOWO2_12_FULL_43_20]|uniref:POTRA domain-containing protein n=1 Tax=Candidatus Taylorbacteria bacterium RIFCSPLOWO2_12_FULL_43_20 TaxID=1802332 RepID=A0A1G2P3Z4_9BACT|nr:MAG: hypothetical protein A2825_01145 [Candidatus Taylorbacteria bacterium RIFCSPHIGHO2_01_FULL_43_120]OHA23406.1 MAG: hypothetical protein A3B98_01630 [Candidatus Taylorbacteria bacterium RIFCSPHIGHO2_02_FULL_43_55]OHA29538.1 MAG: hypothetical protein A3E92_01875 [Candidatus Taylorbacteria bacterium RIFCSPHIGHO2_12_FULL_42_34]OHA31342.1 MAG: hypothetical protein A3B09_02310 [Candidatus Taylorbacteria bacterium RIFCSPLOWO2_01_FULL_43_83]OHA38862.1 MAG: hypothetical protein A3H58_00545 [Candi
MFKKSNLRSKKFARRRKRILLLRMGSLLIVFASAVWLVSYLSSLDKVTISRIGVEGNLALDKSEISEDAYSELEGRYLGILSKKNVLIFPKENIEKKLKEKWKRIDEVKIERSSLTSIAVKITEKKPEYLWCGGEENAPSGGRECFFMDRDGYIFSKAPQFSDSVFFKLFSNINKESPIGEYFADNTDFTNISALISLMVRDGIGATKLVRKDNGEYELYLGDGSRVFLNIDSDYKDAYENLRVFLESDIYLAIDKASSPIDYIDLRYGNKVFYK